MNDKVDLAIIGGTGVYDPELLKNVKRVKVFTPFGATSDMITIGEYMGRKIAFLPRHGEDHHLPPHHVPYRANIWALNELGVTRIIAPRAVGSLREEMKPGDLVIIDQFFDFTKRRIYSFYEGGEVGHISMADPFCSEMRGLAISAAKKLNLRHHDHGANVVIDGPRFSSRAESIYFRDAVKGHTINMTLVPECVLARELQICYLSLDMVTDYDAWSNEVVDANLVVQVMKKNINHMRELLIELIPNIPESRSKCACPNALENAVM